MFMVVYSFRIHLVPGIAESPSLAGELQTRPKPPRKLGSECWSFPNPSGFPWENPWKPIPKLVGGIPNPLKNMSSSVGMMTFPTEWESQNFMFETTKQ
jgi:hypothetical protein